MLREALVELFLAEGFTQFGVEDLSSRLRCSKSTLYAIASSKEQLFTAVVLEFFRRAADRVEERVAAEADPRERLPVYLAGIAAELAPASRAFLDDLTGFAPARELYARNTAFAARRVAQLVEDLGGAGDPSTRAFAGATAALVMEAIQQGRVRTLTGLDDADAYRALADLLVAGVGAPG